MGASANATQQLLDALEVARLDHDADELLVRGDDPVAVIDVRIESIAAAASTIVSVGRS